jgi:hypothetical protein
MNDRPEIGAAEFKGLAENHRKPCSMARRVTAMLIKP